MFLTKNMLIYFGGKLIPAFSSLVIMFLGLRYLGKSEFGKYNLIMNTAVIVSTFTIGWIQQSILRFNSGAESNFEGKKNFDYFTFLASSIAFFLLMAVTAFYFQLSLVRCITVALFTFTFCFFSVILTRYQSQFKATQYVIYESIYYFVVILMSIFLVLQYKKLGFNIFFISMSVGGLIILVFNQKGFSYSSITANVNSKAFFKKAFSYGFPITLWLFISGLFNIADRFVIREFSGYQSVGIYSSVYDFVYKVCGFACLPVLLSVHPAIAKAWNDNQTAQAKMLIKRAIIFEVVILLLILSGFSLFSNLIFNTIFKLEETNLSTIMYPLILSGMLWQMALFIHKPLELCFMQRQMIIGILLSIVTNIVLNVFSIPRFGYKAAAFTTLISTLVYIVYILVVKRLTKGKTQNA